MKMSAGVFEKRRRSLAGVSPVRIATVGSRTPSPRRSAAWPMPAMGERRLRSTSTASAFNGETYTTRQPRPGAWMRASIAERNAASVLPDPVGAMRSVLSPCLMTGQACACAGVGSGNEVRNHSRTAGWNVSRTSLPMRPRVPFRAMEIGLGIDGRLVLSDAEQAAVAAEAAQLGYTSLWTPNRDDAFELCARWHAASGLATGISVLPIGRWSAEALIEGTRTTLGQTGGRFVLGGDRKSVV